MTIVFLGSTCVGKSSYVNFSVCGKPCTGKSSLANLLLRKSDYQLGHEQGYSDGRYNCASQISDYWYKFFFQSSDYRDGYEHGFEDGKIIAEALAYINFDEFRFINGEISDELNNYLGELEEFNNSVYKKGEAAMSALIQATPYKGEAAKHCNLSHKQGLIWTEYRPHRVEIAWNTKLAATLRNQAIQNKSSVSLEGEGFLQNKKVFDFVLQLSWCEPRIRKRKKSTIKFA